MIDEYQMNRHMRRQYVRGDLTIEQLTEEIRRLAKEESANLIYNTNRLFYYAIAMYLHDKMGFGGKRLNRATAYLQAQLAAYNEGYLDLEDMANTLKEECGFEIIMEEFEK